MPDPRPNPVLVTPGQAEPLDAALDSALAAGTSALGSLPSLTVVAQGDPFLAQQLEALRAGWEIRPPAAAGIIARLRTRLAWWLLGPELAQLNQLHATLVRLADSLVVLADEERAARRRIEESLADPRE